MNNTTTIAAVAIFAATYLVLAIGKVAIYRIDRAGAALLGASLMVAAGVLTPEEAYAAFNFDTIILLLGTMIVIANLRVSGLFRLVNYWPGMKNRRSGSVPLAAMNHGSTRRGRGFTSAILWRHETSPHGS